MSPIAPMSHHGKEPDEEATSIGVIDSIGVISGVGVSEGISVGISVGAAVVTGVTYTMVVPDPEDRSVTSALQLSVAADVTLLLSMTEHVAAIVPTVLYVCVVDSVPGFLHLSGRFDSFRHRN